MIDRGSESRSSIVRPPSIHGTLTRHHALATLKRPTSVIIPATVVDENGGNCRDRDREPRLVHLEMKKAHSLGISLVGGNAVGIFIHAVQNESPAFKVCFVWHMHSIEIFPWINQVLYKPLLSWIAKA